MGSTWSGGAGAVGGVSAGAVGNSRRYRYGADGGDIGCDSRGRRGISKPAIQDDWRHRAGAGGDRVLRVSRIGADGAVCDQDGDQLSGGGGLLGTGRLHGNVL